MKFRLQYVNLLFIFITIISCQSNSKKEGKIKNPHNFESIKGITFHEVKRRFENGLSFDTIGFQQEPQWILRFQRNDSVEVYSYELKRLVGFYLHHDHDNYYNFAREWFAVKLLSKDSIVLQRLEVKSLRVKNDARSNVYMTFYSENYMDKVLHKTKEELTKPSAKDTAFVRERIALANAHPLDSTYLFAARNPVKLESKSKAITVEKFSSFDPLTKSSSYDYIYPEYKIEIANAYKKFNYAFRVIVDVYGKITVYDFPTYEEDTKENMKKVLQGICDIYLSNLLKITPGSTLGIPQASLITVYVKGKD
ncbi:hypothetical protein Pedsa_1388 [Pseudopedobacter saltans DSM 12145]|uniref:Lipoprotein n=1 Tax=Pseudopedobacter saltans (strain ATCC 51119 / DSM 12145 / JCM 21818 / CCUG 39354 / LMG 10337 / NBRC 100064 / NCIMB 13643) TaxID=762903 RepID=F0SER4_PSESL|nr:hypothetical protein [Pseudopedobacter saltans]ADY51954.1 hypothetical protein Pedsa_1388 [Pseudopedobacter saltans DSM 12145]